MKKVCISNSLVQFILFSDSRFQAPRGFASILIQRSSTSFLVI